MIRLKNHDEIRRIKDSGSILAELLRELAKIVEPGITTLELDGFSRDFVERKGAKPAFLGHLDYPASLCTSVNNEVIHGIPKKRKLKSGDIIGLDFGVNYKGYISDAAVTLPVGKISDPAQQLMNTTREALELAVEAAREGGRIRDISTAVYTHARRAGFDVVREFCGHGVGFEVHEAPQIPNYIGRGPNPRLKEGMVLAIEPMINAGGSEIAILDDEWTVVTADGSLSAHFEHTVAITADGAEILTDDGGDV
ncbi:MAG: type I methionyl aminopeptidase [Spirochaetota bacterium]